MNNCKKCSLITGGLCEDCMKEQNWQKWQCNDCFTIFTGIGSDMCPECEGTMHEIINTTGESTHQTPETTQNDWTGSLKNLTQEPMEEQIRYYSQPCGKCKQPLEMDGHICSIQNKHINPDDDSTTIIAKATTCCGGHHQTIAGAMLKSKECKSWYDYNQKKMLFDVDETREVDAMSDEHWNAFMEFIKN